METLLTFSEIFFLPSLLQSWENQSIWNYLQQMFSVDKMAENHLQNVLLLLETAECVELAC